MTFSSIPFLFYFFPLFIALYYAVPWKNAALLLASLVFYAWGEPVLVLVLLASLGVNHILGRRVAGDRGKGWLVAGIVFNLAVLASFKYAGFAAEILNGLAGAEVLSIKLTQPIGISFYTFQAISFLIDLRRKDAPPPRGFADTALYIAMFPQLIAGPIVRYKSIADQLQKRTHTAEKFADGARVFTLGLAQKVLLANTFAEVADAAFNAEVGLTAGAAWVGLAAYSLQIFFDFAGYSNMAIGLGRMFGLELPQNFNFPYVAQSVTAFWRRWHMTLSGWFRDYLYIPLGGNRGPAWRTYANLWIVFLLCGLWHGAAIAFVFWGAFHGAFLVLERAFLGRWLAAAPRILRHAYLPLVVALGWVPFRTEHMGEALGYYGALLGGGGGQLRVEDIAPDGMALVFGIGLVAALWPLVKEGIDAVAARLPKVSVSSEVGALARFGALQGALVFLFLASAASLAGGAYNPFIYFRF